MHTWRVASTATIARFDVGPVGRTLRLEVPGNDVPHECTVRKPGCTARSDVTVTATAVASSGTEAGRSTRSQQPAPTAVDCRVSTRRSGTCPTNPPVTDAGAGVPIGATQLTVVA